MRKMIALTFDKMEDVALKIALVKNVNLVSAEQLNDACGKMDTSVANCWKSFHKKT